MVRKAPVALLGLFLVASLFPLTTAGEAIPVYYVVWTPEAAAVDALGGEVVEAYGAFVLAKAGPAALDALRAAFAVEEVSTLIAKQGVTFDTRGGDASVADDLQAGPGDPYLVVQLIGPVQQAWRDRLLQYGDLMDYVPHNAFVLRADAGASDAVAALPFVRFVGPFHAAYKLDPALTSDGPMTMNLAVWGGEPLGPVKEAIAGLGGVVVGESERAFESYLRIEADAGIAKALARLPAINAIEPFWTTIEPLDNAQAAWVTQSGSSSEGATVHVKGLSGRGQTLADADTGLDTNSGTNPTRFTHDAFNDPNVQFIWGGTPNPAHRKVHAYFRLTEGGVVKGTFDDESGHGTHTSGSIASDLAAYNQYNSNDGQSFGGRFVFIDWSNLPVDYFNMFDPTYQVGARLHSNSYGSPHNIAYTLVARQNDDYTYAHQDFLIFRSMGNTGGNTIRPEAVAKNVVSSGATQNGENHMNLASFSSRGPTQDLRVKPTVTAPGEGVTSTYLNNGYASLSGTSMSTPTTAGASGLIRQYFAEGWHGGSGQGSAPGFNPSAALVRGVLINSAVPMTGTSTGAGGLASNPGEVAPLPCAAGICPTKVLSPKWPNGDMGWGIIRLDNTLEFSGDGQGIAVVDGASVGTGGSVDIPVTVTDASKGLKVTLAWSDAPATVGANPTLVNDLDLVVVLPIPGGVVEVKGNVFAGVGGGTNNAAVNNLIGDLGTSGQEVPPFSAPGGSPDRRNVEEQVVFPPGLALTGTYTIRVTGANVPSGSQNFAVVASGGI